MQTANEQLRQLLLETIYAEIQCTLYILAMRFELSELEQSGLWTLQITICVDSKKRINLNTN